MPGLLGNDSAWGKAALHSRDLPGWLMVFSACSWKQCSYQHSPSLYAIWVWSPLTLRTYSKWCVEAFPWVLSGAGHKSRRLSLKLRCMLLSPKSQMTETSYVLEVGCVCARTRVWCKAFKRRAQGSGPLPWSKSGTGLGNALK